MAIALAVGASGASAASPPVLAFSPSPFDFGWVLPGKTATQAFTLTNTGGSAAAPVITVQGSSAFTVPETVDMCTATVLEPGDSCTVDVQFAPTTPGALTATLNAISKKPAAEATVSLSGRLRSLVGETLTSDQVEGSTLDGTCSPHSSTDIEYSVSGTATGPFPGTFTESGGFVADRRGILVHVESKFTINSPAGTVTGTLHGFFPPAAWGCPGPGLPPSPVFRSGQWESSYDTSIGDAASELQYSGELGGKPPSFTEAFGNSGSTRHAGSRCDGRSATILGRARGDRIAGTLGNDVIVAGAGNDRISAGRGNDVVCAGAGNDVIHGGPGNDRLFGGAGNDVIYGGPGNDRIDPGPGRDHVFAGPGDDRVFAVDGQRDVIDCGPGHDVAIVDSIDVTRHCEHVIRVPGLASDRAAPR